MRSDPRVDDAARSILDGEAVDWSALEASSDQDTLGLIEQLKLLSEVGRVHRSDTPAVASALPERRTSTTDTRRQLTHWGHLQVMEALGSGSFGDVYLALDTRLEREVALKLLRANEAGFTGDSSTVIHEGRLLARVRHPNVVTIYGADAIDGRVGLWMEFVDGSTLDAIAVTPSDAFLRSLGRTFSGPAAGNLASARVDAYLSDRHRTFVRYLLDDSKSLGASSEAFPSAWSQRPVRAQQTLGSLTSIFSANVLHDARVSYFRTEARAQPREDCGSPCLGHGAPRIGLSDGGPPMLTVGGAARMSNEGHRLQVSDSVTWQRASHLLRVGADWEHTSSSLVNPGEPVELTLWSPESMRQHEQAIAVPETFASTSDLLHLPLRSFTTRVAPGDVMGKSGGPERRFQAWRVHASNRWSPGARLTLNGGLAWSYEPGVLNEDLPRPEWLAPLVGATEFQTPRPRPNAAANAGLVWRATDDGRTVVRAGAGYYVDSLTRTVALNLATERALLSPVGTTAVVMTGSNLSWNGQRLNFPTPTAFTGADLLAILPAIRAQIANSLVASRDPALVNLDVAREGRNLYDPSYATPYAVHATAGIEHELRRGTVIGADVIWKRFAHAFINGIDYNRFSSIEGPVIPACRTSRPDAATTCSNGPLYFDTTSGRARFAGVVARLDQRFSAGTRILASYAYGSFVGSNGTGTATSETTEGRVTGFDNNDWSANQGPLPGDIRHVLNVSGFVVLPWQFDVSFNLAAASRPPFSVYVGAMDFNGDGTTNDLLPGTRVHEFNRSLSKQDLVRLVDDYNRDWAGRATPSGRVAPALTLPRGFTFNDGFSAVDVRVARSFRFRTARVSLLVDVFNVFDTMNLTGYSGNVAAQSAFGQPTGRVGGAFGSGGPRAVQLGARVDF